MSSPARHISAASTIMCFFLQNTMIYIFEYSRTCWKKKSSSSAKVQMKQKSLYTGHVLLIRDVPTAECWRSPNFAMRRQRAASTFQIFFYAYIKFSTLTTNSLSESVSNLECSDHLSLYIEVFRCVNNFFFTSPNDARNEDSGKWCKVFGKLNILATMSNQCFSWYKISIKSTKKCFEISSHFSF
jgi:hypothetical protein